jgi:hypothetical protein
MYFAFSASVKMAYCYLFPAKLLMLKEPNRLTMAGVLGLITGSQSQRRLVVRSEKAPWVDPRVLELQTAMEILVEVFGIRISEVEEMLRQRSEVEVEVPSCSGEGALWPESFCLAE